MRGGLGHVHALPQVGQERERQRQQTQFIIAPRQLALEGRLGGVVTPQRPHHRFPAARPIHNQNAGDNQQRGENEPLDHVRPDDGARTAEIHVQGDGNRHDGDTPEIVDLAVGEGLERLADGDQLRHRVGQNGQQADSRAPENDRTALVEVAQHVARRDVALGFAEPPHLGSQEKVDHRHEGKEEHEEIAGALAVEFRRRGHHRAGGKDAGHRRADQGQQADVATGQEVILGRAGGNAVRKVGEELQPDKISKQQQNGEVNNAHIRYSFQLLIPGKP